MKIHLVTLLNDDLLSLNVEALLDLHLIFRHPLFVQAKKCFDMKLTIYATKTAYNVCLCLFLNTFIYYYIVNVNDYIFILLFHLLIFVLFCSKQIIINYSSTH